MKVSLWLLTSSILIKEGVLNNYKVLFLEEAETNLTTLFHV